MNESLNIVISFRVYRIEYYAFFNKYKFHSINDQLITLKLFQYFQIKMMLRSALIQFIENAITQQVLLMKRLKMRDFTSRIDF
jgi:hypothetical protein